MSNGGARKWTPKQRTTIFRLRTAYALSREQVHDIFGRVHGDELKQDGRTYAPQNIQDEFSQRWGSGKAKIWDAIDSPTPSAKQQQLVAEVDQDIVAAAALNSGVNYLTGNVNQPIALRAPAQAYVSKGRPVIPAASTGGSRSKRKSRVQELESEEEEEEQDIEMEEDVGSETEAVEENSRADQEDHPGQAPQGQPAAVPTIVLQSPQGTVAPVPPAPLAIAPPLEMIHFRLIDQHNGGTYNVQRSPRAFVDPSSPLYKYGGPVTRVKNGTASLDEFDVMTCDAQQCDFCGTYDQIEDKTHQDLDRLAREAEHNDDIPAQEDSPYHGRPFVHAVRDLRNTVPGGAGIKGRVFAPAGPIYGLYGEHTIKGAVIFDDRYNLLRGGGGCVGKRHVVTCGDDCTVCLPKKYRRRAAARKDDRDAGGQIRRLVEEDE